MHHVHVCVCIPSNKKWLHWEEVIESERRVRVSVHGVDPGERERPIRSFALLFLFATRRIAEELELNISNI